MIDIQTVESIHNILIEKFGGSKGIRDIGALEAAIARPYATFDKEELYPTTINKAAEVFESINKSSFCRWQQKNCRCY